MGPFEYRADVLRCDAITIRDWRKSCAREPILRVGIVLDEDALATVEMAVPDADYATASRDGAAPIVRATPVVARLTGGAVALRVGKEAEQVSDRWCLTPVRPQRLRRGAGVRVRNLVAGRGFHWQKRVDHTLGGRIELRPGRRGVVVVNELPLEQYLAGVITAEMSGACPRGFLKSQCVTARSWLLALSEPKHDEEPFDRCNDDCCQRYQGTGALTEAALDAVSSTRGVALVDRRGDIVDANYSKSCGGIVESPEHVWGRPKPGLRALVDAPDESPEQRFFPITRDNLEEYLDGPWLSNSRAYCGPNIVPEDQLSQYLGRVDEGGRYFRWTVTHRREDLEQRLRTTLPDACDLARFWDLNVVARGVSGRAIEIELDFEDDAGRRRSVRVESEYRIREVLRPEFLYSSAFTVHVQRDAHGVPHTVTLRGAGWGHGVGLCQIGALGMALQGITYEDILTHYFPEATLQRVYE